MASAQNEQPPDGARLVSLRTLAWVTSSEPQEVLVDQEPGGTAGKPLDATTARRWVALAEAALRRSRAVIDSLNVYPVPDGDTGTNLHLTVAQAGADAEALPADTPLDEVCRVIARSALLGARGNSGIIASQLLRGWSDALAGCQTATAELVVAALERADRTAWEAVEVPVEGTMLSVTRAASAAAATALADGAGDVADVLAAVVRAARQALDRTPQQLAVLADAGVVDAGGAGVLVLLESLRAAVAGNEVDVLDHLAPVETHTPAVAGEEVCATAPAGGPAYEVMYLLAADEDAVPTLRKELAALGDSLVVVGGADLWHVHVHVDDPGAAVEAGLRAGRPSTIRITHFETAAAAHAGLPAAGPSPTPSDAVGTGRAQAGTGEAGTVEAGTGTAGTGTAGTGTAGTGDAAPSVGVVAWAAGPGLAGLFRDCGVVPVEPPPGRRPSTAEVLEAVGATGSRAVVVLPNDPDTLAVARAAARTAREAGLRVTVVPTRAQVQGLAAAAVHDVAAELEEDVAAMSAAAGATRHGAVTVAVRDAITMAGPCRTGDVLGVVDGDFAVVGAQLAEVAQDVLERLLSGGGEIVTLVTGRDAPVGLADAVAAVVRRRHHHVEVSVVDGGQPRYPLLLGVE